MPVLFIDSGGVVDVTFRAISASSAGGATRTFAGMAIGTPSGGRYVAACLAWSETGAVPSSVTIGGVAADVRASIRSGSVSGGVAIAIALVPTGATADVVVVFSDSADDAACATYSIAGISSTAVAASGTSSAANPTASLSCQAGGAIIGCALSINNPPRSAAWTGISEDSESGGYGFNSTRNFTAAHANFGTAQSSLACTCTFSGSSSGGTNGAFVALNPS